MPTFDVCFKEPFDIQEIEAATEEAAKLIYLEGVKRALDVTLVEAFELEISSD